ncbi:MAG: protein kinase [Elusimicrobiota bacterium]|nr:protein kinase [Elusimicrobiota bacterium]
MSSVMNDELSNSVFHNLLMTHDRFAVEKLRVMSQEQFARAEPMNPVAHTLYGADLLRQGRTQDALAAANKAVELGGGSNALSLRAAANSQLGNYQEAVDDARRALEQDPANQQAMAALKLSEGRVAGDAGAAAAQAGAGGFSGAGAGRGFAGGGSGSSGLATFGAASRHPGAAAAGRFNDQARSAFAMGDYQATLDLAARSLASDPTNPMAHYLRSMALRQKGDWRGAAEAAAEGLKHAPKNSALLAAQATALNRSKQYKDALAAANLALEVNPRDPWAFANRAMALGGLGDKQGMLDNLRQAAAIDPSFQASLDSALQTPQDADMLFLFPGESAPQKKGAAAAPGRTKSFGVLAGAAALGGLLLALGLLSAFIKPLQTQVGSVFTRLTRRSPSVSTMPAEGAVRAAGLLRGQYELGRQIGAGGMGLVFEGTDRSLNRRVAVKRMRDEIRLDPRERARFVAEAKTVAALHHPNIVDIYAVIEEADDLHLVFEFVEGRTVHELMSAKGRLAPADAVKIVRGAAEALDFAHGRGVIHRDMKPSNLMLDGTGRVKVMDFGIARAAKDAMTRFSMTNTIVGTPPYMAPEQEQGQVRKESDVYALAVCAYELLCGRLPFPGVGAGMLMNKINLSYVPPSKMTGGLPAAIDEVFAKAFQPDPDKRYRASGEFAAALESALSAAAKA